MSDVFFFTFILLPIKAIELISFSSYSTFSTVVNSVFFAFIDKMLYNKLKNFHRILLAFLGEAIFIAWGSVQKKQKLDDYLYYYYRVFLYHRTARPESDLFPKSEKCHSTTYFLIKENNIEL